MKDQSDLYSHLLAIMREEIASRESELDAIRKRSRCRLGKWAIESLLLRWSSIAMLFKFLPFYLKRRGKHSGAAFLWHQKPTLPKAAMQSRFVVFGECAPNVIADDEAWVSEDAELVASRLDSDSASAILVIRKPNQAVLRRLERAKLQGWQIWWAPEKAVDMDIAMAAYAVSHADKCLVENRA
jgi:hypothetical protein